MIFDLGEYLKRPKKWRLLVVPVALAVTFPFWLDSGSGLFLASSIGGVAVGADLALERRRERERRCRLFPKMERAVNEALEMARKDYAITHDPTFAEIVHVLERSKQNET